MRFLRAIKDAQAVGFTLAEIGEYLRASRRSASPTEVLRVRMASKIDEIDRRIAGLRRMRDELARVVGCGCDSLDHCTCGAAYLARRGREPGIPAERLHVTNGESAANTLRRTALGGAVLPWQDVLHEGPVPAVPRVALLRTPGGVSLGVRLGGPSGDPLVARAARPSARSGARRRSVRSCSGSSTTSTTSCSCWTCWRWRTRPERRPSAIVVDSFPGRPAFRGLGELSEEELETLWPDAPDR